MKLYTEYIYNYGILVSDKGRTEYAFFDDYDEDVCVEVDFVYVDTANNPTKTTKIFANECEWNSKSVTNWICERMNNV